MAVIDEYTEENLYEVLGVKKNAGLDEITEAYIKAKENLEKWKKYSWYESDKEKTELAYAVLSDSNRRKKYDTYQYYVKHRKDEKSEQDSVEDIRDKLVVICASIVFVFACEIYTSATGDMNNKHIFILGLVAYILSLLSFEMIYKKLAKRYNITEKLYKFASKSIQKKNEKIRKKNRDLYIKLGLDE